LDEGTGIGLIKFATDMNGDGWQVPQMTQRRFKSILTDMRDVLKQVAWHLTGICEI
jgi:hypothetical protein